jgi:hypothetical protein
VKPTKAADQFKYEYDLPEHQIEKRARKEKNWFSNAVPPGRSMEFERTDFVENMENSIRELNGYFAKQTLRGGSHEGCVRIFRNGDDPDFDWDKGGRFYSHHFPSYQGMSGERRRRMTERPPWWLSAGTAGHFSSSSSRHKVGPLRWT